MTQNTISLSETNISSSKFNKWKQAIAIIYYETPPPPPTSSHVRTTQGYCSICSYNYKSTQ